MSDQSQPVNHLDSVPPGGFSKEALEFFVKYANHPPRPFRVRTHQGQLPNGQQLLDLLLERLGLESGSSHRDADETPILENLTTKNEVNPTGPINVNPGDTLEIRRRTSAGATPLGVAPFDAG